MTKRINARTHHVLVLRSQVANTAAHHAKERAKRLNWIATAAMRNAAAISKAGGHNLIKRGANGASLGVVAD